MRKVFFFQLPFLAGIPFLVYFPFLMKEMGLRDHHAVGM
jgi:hypothetical protein